MKEPRTRAPVREVPPSSPIVAVPLPLPLCHVLADVRAGFFALCLDTGRPVLHALMEEDRRRLCGTKWLPNPQRRSAARPSARNYRASPTVPTWNQILTWLREMDLLRQARAA